ncbi:MAG: hydrogenase formation protein HypD [Deltaproteobacteria bacterium HGW-Deltaproteobacteria-7]|jgi:hydrogenase expression/formation protein HypD|nr:MAG: hydrogenase formation protein HypD [Deltaproteobacteria bacterium HGW-Deltaproteobacteria-7]PKN70555.1 MAG: hydrogenase formation protein HypD [Deltaproteobacteria bacterium HGW-Deltaproteobacteria-12]
MKFIDEYRDPAIVKGLLKHIASVAQRLENPVTIMEICGSHTYAIGRFGIRKLLPDNIRLISGPGCPVCVTSARDVDIALHLTSLPNVIFATFGDMLRVPGTGGDSLQKKRAEGADVRVVSSADECIGIALEHPQKEIIMMGIGFETTAPTIAAVISACRKKDIRNFSVFSAHKIVPPAIHTLLADPLLKIDGFLCPGHVSTMIGADAYRMMPEAGRAAVITGFEPVDILEGVWMLLQQIESNKMDVAIQYSRGVRPEGNPRAMAILQSVFEITDAQWRGLGTIPQSGLTIRSEFAAFDTLKNFSVPDIQSNDIPGCGCGDILRGIKLPLDCALFKKVCTPVNPVGPCMVSSEGTCAAYYKYY